MKDVMGIINLNEEEEFFRELTEHRPVAAVPFGGRYRLIDFILSNMINSGIPNVGILVKKENDRSLMDHLRSGKEWDLARKRDGLFLLPPGHSHSNSGIMPGDLRHFYTHFDYIQKSRQKYVIIGSSNMIANMDFRPVFQYHLQQKADVTLLYKTMLPDADFMNCTSVKIAADGRVTGMELHPLRIISHNIAMGMYIMEKAVLLNLIDAAISRGGSDFVRDGIMRNLDQFKVLGYAHEGYMARIHSVRSYYQQSMALLETDIWRNLFTRPGLIYTKVKDEAPARYKDTSRVKKSLIADGSVIEGQVENSILFRAVKVHKGAVIRNSILMQKVDVGENAALENMICDKEVYITAGKKLRGEINFPLVVRKGMVV
ncbi:nucleotide-diphospho-sugar transferases [Lucifera butyrica]|uniref:Nucleotide-diphospho-sugar transferases n=1 Tax=Lucifera butyrica TaxID=1351585 RepID=A0A498R0T7_9FIRM|nr:glucose-1-phosphate adenylyltransferase subunit GlgD [Lucifera butyrica]VBB05044.1 nucleotide-diphospho-sugar transferases [Lucifera butyrica]